VFIDDLDRTLPDQVAVIMKNLKLILEMERCVFLLGMDMDIVADRIESFYRGRSQPEISLRTADTRFALTSETTEIKRGFGKNFLEKLVQITIPVPRLVRAGAVEYIKKLGFVDEIVEIVSWAPSEDITNPRRLKRYLNWLSVSLQLIMAAAELPEGVDNTFALRSLALRRDYRVVYDKLRTTGSVDKISWPEASDEQSQQGFAAYLGKLASVQGGLARFENFVAASSSMLGIT
jgi:hypothetical protein